WANGGPTILSNLALLCRRHHRSVHEEGFQLERLADGELQFRCPKGEVFPDVPRPAGAPADAVEVLRGGNAAAGIQVGESTLMPSWFGERFNVGYAISVLHPRAIGH